MKRMFIAVVAVVCAAIAFSQHATSLSEIVTYMSTNDYRRSFMMTNSIDLVMMSATGVVERTTCKLLKASILLDHSENMANSTSFDVATNLCREIETDLSGMIAWQRIGALCKFTNAMIGDGHPDIAFIASTNLLNEFQGSPCVDVETNVWNVLFKPGGLDIMSPLEYIRANAAASRFKMDTSADILMYTNGLPQEIPFEIFRR